MFFKIAQKVAKYLSYFCKKICSQELSKIAESGHTVQYLRRGGILIECFHSTHFCSYAKSNAF